MNSETVLHCRRTISRKRWLTLHVAVSFLAALLTVRAADEPLADARGSGATADVLYHAAPKALPAGAVTSDWTSLLGPTHDMRSPETKLLRRFGDEQLKCVWEMRKGEGFSSPAVCGERLVLFHRVGDEEVVDCLNALDGRRYWRFASASAYSDRYNYNGGPRCAPVIDAGRVFTFGAAGKLHCLDLLTGAVLWKRDIVAEYKLKQSFFGVGTTPLAHDGKLIVNVGADGGPCVVAFDARSGEVVWRAGTRWGASYASPVPAVLHGKARVLVFAGGESDPPTGGLLCIDPADGRVVSEFPWRGRRFESVNATSPVVLGDTVFISECYGKGSALVAVDESGACRAAWTNRRFTTHFNLAVAQDGYLYGACGHDGEAFGCVEIATGADAWRTRPQWEETISTPQGPQTITAGTARCWLLPVDGRCLCLGEFGHLLWLDLKPDVFHELSRTRLFNARQTWSPPVLSRGLLYVCQNAPDSCNGTPPRLLCYDLRASE